MLTRSRMFQFKPDGDVTLMTVQDAKGIPISTFQDPLHYPHHTKFLAPGALLVPITYPFLLCNSLTFFSKAVIELGPLF